MSINSKTNLIQFICLARLTMAIVTKQLHISLNSGYGGKNVLMNVYFPNEQAYGDGSKKKLRERARGRNLEGDQTQKGIRHYLGEKLTSITVLYGLKR